MNQKVLENIVLSQAKELEKKVDKELNYYNDVKDDEDELTKIRKRRISELKKKAMEKKQWKLEGHGKVHYIHEYKEFMDNIKRNKRCVAFFYKKGSKYCDVMDQHLRKICPLHIESKFIFVDAEKAKILTNYFKIWMLPSVVLIKDQRSDYTIVGLEELGKSGAFKTIDLERLMAKHDSIIIQEKFTEDDYSSKY